MKKTIPDIYIKVYNSKNEPVNSVAISLKFKMGLKNDYTYILYKFNELDDSYFLSGNDIIKYCDNTLSLFQMDYRCIEYNFSNEIGVEILSSKGISRVLEGYNFWGKYMKYPENYKEDLEKAHVSTEVLERKGIFDSLRLEHNAIPDCVNFKVIKPS